MEIINDIEYTGELEPTTIALGTFDGVHIAHQAVISTAVESEFTPAVFTFNRIPAGVISGRNIGELSTISIKQQLIADMGVKYYISPDFLSVKDMSPRDFVLMLKEKFNAHRIVCGYDFRFGKDASGAPMHLKQLCREFKMKFSVVTPRILEDFTPISSTLIRHLISSGEIVKARELLGHDFSYDFVVEQGNHLGTKLSAPTINQIFPINFVKPRFGVYASKTEIDGKVYKSVTNVGIKPTVGENEPMSETHIFDYSGDLYQKKVKVSLYFFIREERKFENLEELSLAISNDVKYVKDMIY